MNDSVSMEMGMLLILGWNAGLLFLQDLNQSRKSALNLAILLVILAFFAPILLSLLFSSDNPFDESSGGGIFFILYFIIVPLGIPTYLVLVILKVINAIKAKQEKKQWFLFAFVYLVPFVLIVYWFITEWILN